MGTENTELSYPAGDRRKHAEERFILSLVKGLLVIQIVESTSGRLGYFTMDSSGEISSADAFFRKQNKIIADRGIVKIDTFKTQMNLLISEIRQNRE